ncbi:MAG: hypothetical protein P4L76_05055 [Beijerinckiaceae bacterium]|nr:hypothetical protein [Beijerinckiaceae bacterium]
MIAKAAHFESIIVVLAHQNLAAAGWPRVSSAMRGKESWLANRRYL